MTHGILTIDIGGTGLKAAVVDIQGHMLSNRVRMPTPHPCPPQVLLARIKAMQAKLPAFDRISIGFPGVVRAGCVITAPNLDTQLWAGFPLAQAVSQALGGKPSYLINDADMQGLSLISGKGLEFVVTLGTGVGTAWYQDGVLLPHMELSQHPIFKNETYDRYLGDATRKAIGQKRWNLRVEQALELIDVLLRPDRIFLSGGNAINVQLPPHRHVVIGSNDAAFYGGAALWRNEFKPSVSTMGTSPDYALNQTSENLMNATPNPLNQLATAGQAVWLDFLSREFLENGDLARHIAENSLTGVTSNPAIFEAAMRSVTYDAVLQARLDQADADPNTLYEHLAIEDIQKAADILYPVYQRLDGKDGYVSLEVSPYFAYDTEATLAEARRFWQAVNRPNLMIKVPGTPAGIPAIQQLITEGINVNITLLFSLQAYQDVAQAYIKGLSARLAAGKAIHKVASVASFFISRIDTRIDQRIDQRIQALINTSGHEAQQASPTEKATPAATNPAPSFHDAMADTPAADTAAELEALKALQGQVAIANAKLAYQHYLEIFTETRQSEWSKLAQHGAQPQRLLWASTGTKNPNYSPTLYVDGLIGPNTVNTMPQATLEAFRQTGKIVDSLTCDLPQAQQILEKTKHFWLGLDEVTQELEVAGAQIFCDAADTLLSTIATKRLAYLGDRVNSTTYSLPAPLAQAVDQTLVRARQEGWTRRLWEGDASLWTHHHENEWLGWLAAGLGQTINLPAITQLAQALTTESYTHAVLLGMGGSSLGPEVLAQTLGKTGAGLSLHVLDSTNPDEIHHITHTISLRHTLFIVSSKSGSTLEPELLNAHFYAAVQKIYTTAHKEKSAHHPDANKQAGQHFIAITDPGSNLEKFANTHNYRAIFSGNPQIGGRYSVLSAFGMVPLGLMGQDVDAFLHTTQPMVHACAASAPPAVNPGVRLGIVLGTAANLGHNKLTFITSPSLVSIGAWLEQLIAESTGKNGKGIIPVDLEPLGEVSAYGADRVFVYLRCASDPAPQCEKQVQSLQALAQAGHPVITITLPRPEAIGQEFFRWEIATAIAGACLAINPFDQPDVEASKIKTRVALQAAQEKNGISPPSLLAQDGDLHCYGPAKYLTSNSATLQDILKTHFARLNPGEGHYAAVLAYIARTPRHEHLLIDLRKMLRDKYRVATVGGFGPRFLHSTGQAYKGGPNQGVFLQITADPKQDLPAPAQKVSFGTVQAAQALGDLQVLAERGRRYLHIHIGGSAQHGHDPIERGLRQLIQIVKQALH